MEVSTCVAIFHLYHARIKNLIPRHLPNFHQENIYAIELAKFVLKIKALRDIMTSCIAALHRTFQKKESVHMLKVGFVKISQTAHCALHSSVRSI